MVTIAEKLNEVAEDTAARIQYLIDNVIDKELSNHLQIILEQSMKHNYIFQKLVLELEAKAASMECPPINEPPKTNWNN
jgi:hypothetical protein